MYCGMPKGMCLTEATSNSEKIKSIALAIIELHVGLSEGISQLVSQSVSHSITKKFRLIFFQISYLLVESISGRCEGLFGLSFTNTASSLSGKSETGFWVIFSWATPKHLWSLLYSTIVHVIPHTCMLAFICRDLLCYCKSNSSHMVLLLLFVVLVITSVHVATGGYIISIMINYKCFSSIELS